MSFWGKKFGAGAPAQIPGGVPRPPTQVPPQLLPQGMAGRQAQAVERYASQLPAFQGQPDAPYDGWQPNTLNPKDMDEVLPLWHWRGNPRGAAGEQLGPCPDCGSGNYFSRREGSVMHLETGQMMPPAPHCFDCGYPRQQGATGPTTVSGQTQLARQAAAPAPPAGTLAVLTRSAP